MNFGKSQQDKVRHAVHHRQWREEWNLVWLGCVGQKFSSSPEQNWNVVTWSSALSFCFIVIARQWGPSVLTAAGELQQNFLVLPITSDAKEQFLLSPFYGMQDTLRRYPQKIARIVFRSNNIWKIFKAGFLICFYFN